MPKKSATSTTNNASGKHHTVANKNVTIHELEDGMTVKIFEDTLVTDQSTTKAIELKGVVNSNLNAYFMQLLNRYGIPTHFAQLTGHRTQVVIDTADTGIVLKIRNVTAGSLCESFNIEEGRILSNPLLEFYIKQEGKPLKLVSEQHLLTFQLTMPEELNAMKDMAIQANSFLQGLGAANNVEFVDIELSFGRLIKENEHRLFINGEITPDNCRIWELGSDKKLGREAITKNNKQLSDAYIELLNKFGIELPDLLK